MIILHSLLFANLLLYAHGDQAEVKHECYRNGTCDGQIKRCSYNFTIEYSYKMSEACSGCHERSEQYESCARLNCIPSGGLNRPYITVNGDSPGPSIQVCKDDVIIVKVTNHLLNGEGTTIHWHGLHQRESPHMDGTGFITQCPIGYGNSFTYEFNASEAGTHFWHAHVGFQRQDGLYGSLVVREKDDPHRDTYDFDLMEHSVLVTDWLDNLALIKFMAHYHGPGNNFPEHILINGKGINIEQQVFKVDQGKRYRFRVASNAGTNCPMKVYIENHVLKVIASDGHPVKPVEVDSLVIYAGERFDFVLHANQKHGSYQMHVEGLQDCSNQREQATVQYQEKDRQYENKEPYQPSDIQLNSLNERESEKRIPISKLEALESDDDNSDGDQNVSTFYLAMDFHTIKNPHFLHDKTPQINNISFRFPPVPLLTQHDELPDSMFTNLKTGELGDDIKSCSEEFCENIISINAKLNEIIELVLIDEGVPYASSHPMHLHGYSFRVVAMGKLGEKTSAKEVFDLHENNDIEKNLQNAPLKDTVIVPDGGYTIVRFKADNPGWWFFHCHLEFHVEVGMGLVLHVGTDNDLSGIPENFPKCPDWPVFPGKIQDQVMFYTIPVTDHKKATPWTPPLWLFIFVIAVVFFVLAVIAVVLLCKKCTSKKRSGQNLESDSYHLFKNEGDKDNNVDSDSGSNNGQLQN